MKFVALLTIVDPVGNQRHRPAHLDYLNQLFKQGKVVEAGPFADGAGGLVIYDCVDEDEAMRLAQADPVVSTGVRTLVLRAWNPLSLPLD